MTLFDTKVVSIFKNGCGYFVKRGEIIINIDNGGIYRLEKDHIPRAKFGTLWFHNNNLIRVGSKTDSVTQQIQASNIVELLRANLGKEIMYTLKSGGNNNNNKIGPVSIEHVHDSMIQLLDSATNEWIVILPNDIQGISFINQKPNQLLQTTQTKPVLELCFKTPVLNEKGESNKNNNVQNVDLVYLQDNIGWVPNYNIEMISHDKAILSLRAVVLNDAEDIQNAEMNFVVGAPLFKYSAIESPLSSSSVVEHRLGVPEFFHQLGHAHKGLRTRVITDGDYGGIDSEQGYTRSRTITEPIERDEEEDTTYNNNNNNNAKIQEDLCYYTAPGTVTIKKNERSIVNLLMTECTMEHTYEIDLKTNRPPSPDGSYHFSQDNKDKVYHYIKLQNDSSMPWTTGTAMVTKRDNDDNNNNEKENDNNVTFSHHGIAKPICQDTLNFTPLNAFCKIKLVTAPDITVQVAETILNRKTCDNKNSKNNNSYCTFVTHGGKIKITNYKTKSVKVVLYKRLGGLLEKTLGGVSMRNYLFSKKNTSSSSSSSYSQHQTQQQTETTWHVELKAGETKIIEYKYGKHERVYN